MEYEVPGPRSLVPDREARQGALFEPAPALPGGMAYEPDFLAPAEEAALLETIRTLALEEARYKQYTAKRRVASFGSSYDYEAHERTPAPPLPSFLYPLREKAGACSKSVRCLAFIQYGPGRAPAVRQLRWCTLEPIPTLPSP